MKTTKLVASVGAAALSLAYSSASVQATEGYFSHGYGAVNKSMAGAGVATGFDAMSQATNPASLALVDSQFTADLSVFSPRRGYEFVGSSEQDSDRNYFVVPSLAGAYEIDDVSSYGWALYGNGGMNTTYAAPGPFGGGKTGVDLAQAFLQFTYATEVAPDVFIGISPIIAAQRFKAFGLSPFAGFSSDDTRLTDKGYSWSYGYGGKIGLQAPIGAGFTFGASYQSEMFMTDFDDYAGLFSDGGEFNIPAALQIGFAWNSGSRVIVALDYKRIYYGDIDAIANDASGLAPGSLGSTDGPGFGWETVDAVKLGVEFAASETVKLRAGIGINDNPIPASEVSFNILAPGVQEQHYTAGATWQATPNSAFTIGAMYSPTNSVTGPFLFGGDARIEMYQWEATLGWTWIF